jgi:hypothetical protein
MEDVTFDMAEVKRERDAETRIHKNPTFEESSAMDEDEMRGKENASQLSGGPGDIHESKRNKGRAGLVNQSRKTS